MKTENNPMIQLLLSSQTEEHSMNTIPVYIRKPGEGTLIDMDKVYNSELAYIFWYITQAYCIDWEKMKKYPFSEYLLTEHAHIWNLTPCWQIIFTQLCIEEQEMIEVVGVRLCRDKKISKKDRQELIKESNIFLELSRSMLIKYSLLGFLVRQCRQLSKHIQH